MTTNMINRLSILAAFAISLLPTQSALALTPAELAGEYTSVVDNGTFGTSGRFRLILNKNGRGSVAVKLGSEAACVVLVGMDKGFEGGLIPIGSGDMSIRLVINPGPDGNPILTGEVEEDGEIYTVLAPKVAADAGPAQGRATFLIGSAAGSGNTGSGVAKVSKSGRVKGVASVKGGRPVTFGGRLSPAYKLPIAVRLAGKAESLVGNVTFSTTTIIGSFTFHTPARDQALFVAGTSFNSALPALNASAPSFPLDIHLNGGPSIGTATWLSNGTIRSATLDNNWLRISVNSTTGLMTGKSGDNKLRGIASQGTNTLVGLVNGQVPFEIRPATPQ